MCSPSKPAQRHGEVAVQAHLDDHLVRREALAHADRVGDEIALADLGAGRALEAVLQRLGEPAALPAGEEPRVRRGPRGRSRRRTRRPRGTPARCARRGAGRTPRRPFPRSPRRGTRGGPCPGRRSSRDADTTDGSTIWWMVRSGQLGDVRMGRGEHAPRHEHHRGRQPAQALRRARGRPGRVASPSRRARSSGSSAPTAPARPRPSSASRGSAERDGGSVRVLGHDPATDPAALRELRRRAAAGGRAARPAARRRGPRAVRVLLPRAGRHPRARRRAGARRAGATARSPSSPAASASSSRSRCRSSATRRSRCSTS